MRCETCLEIWKCEVNEKGITRYECPCYYDWMKEDEDEEKWKKQLIVHLRENGWSE